MNLLSLLFSAAVVAGAQPVEVTTVVSKTMERRTKLPGEFLPFQTVDLHARITGYVEKVHVDRGSMVKAGDVLVELSAPEMTAQLAEANARIQVIESQKAEAEAKVVAAQSTFERIKAASATPGAIAGNELILAEKAVEAARAVVRSHESAQTAARASVDAQRDLMNYLKVTAPFDGVITERYAHPGALAGPGVREAMLRLEQHSRLRLVVAVPEGDVGGIPRGARVPFSVPAYPGESFSGVIARVSRVLDPKTRTMPVEMDVSNPAARLSPGMYPEVGWPMRRARASLMVPPTAIVTTTERAFVIRVNNGKAEWVDVSRGAPQGDLVEVLGALSVGDTIVKRATDEIRQGSPVAGK
ncbi:MAG: efflux RND transporter periplasmic adaptor subunit [Bryobacteraceae bacterium]|nr:efflux RND transporter periplasmic adaptor subunit [Bryobacteraceae bacterium]